MEASAFIVFAKTRADAKAHGIGEFLLSMDSPGIARYQVREW